MHKTNRYKQQLENFIVLAPSTFLSINVIVQIAEPLSRQSEVLCLLTFFSVPIGFHVLFRRIFAR